MSSSPAPSVDSQAPAKTQEQITFRFCRECSNMLYPKEDKITSKLMFACRTCQYSEEAQSSCVFRNNMYNTVGETAGVTQDVGSDPTVGATHLFHFCCLCGAEVERDGEGYEDVEEDEEIEAETDEMDEGYGSADHREEKRRGGMGGLTFAEMSQMEEDEYDEEQEEEEEQQVGDERYEL